jgi:xanthine dehydrogenase accessory factor
MRLDLLHIVNKERAARRAVAVVTALAGGAQRVVRAHEASADPLAAYLETALRMSRSASVEHEGEAYFITVYVPPVRILAIGAVHITQALAPMAKIAGFDLIVIDPRTAFATAERFADVEILAQWPDDVIPTLGLDAYTAVGLFTHDPKIDDQALIAALKARCFYIGALGSKKTHAKRCERMSALGFSAEDMARIHAPIGLDIGSVSPAEIAVSVLAEIISALRQKPRRAEV